MKPRTTGYAVLGAVALALVFVVGKYGTLSPCGILRAKMRQQAAQQGGLVGFMSQVASDQLVDGLLTAQYGELTSGKCVKLLVQGK